MGSPQLKSSVLTDEDWERLLSPKFRRKARIALEVFRREGNRVMARTYVDDKCAPRGGYMPEPSQINGIWRRNNLPYRIVVIKQMAYRRSQLQIYKIEDTAGP